MILQKFFIEYASALLTYSAKQITTFYSVPLTVYSDNNIQQVTEIKVVETFWEQGVKPYSEMGIQKSVPKIISEEQLSKTLFIAKVLWINYDEADKEVARETNFYILKCSENEIKICGLIIMSDIK